MNTQNESRVMKRIPLPGGKFSLVDEDDFEKLSKFRWCLTASGYAYHGFWKNGKCKNIRMHRMILGTIKKKITDHINHDKLDNRKSNLRICTNSQNQMNRLKQPNTKSSFKGVFPIARLKKFSAFIMKNKKIFRLGYFKTEIEAARAYNEAAKKHFGEFACLNKV